MNKKLLAIIAAVIVLAAIGVFYFVRPSAGPLGTHASINVVAAENFYGNIAQQLGGDLVSVTSILSNPNVDPHEYESSVQDGIAITNADVVIENGLDYDTWMDKLLSASPDPDRILITGGDIAPDVLPDNPHVWYGIDNIPAIARAITNAFEKKDLNDTVTFETNLATFDNSLTPLQDKLAEIKTNYAGTPVGLTESIYLYQTQPMGLNVLTPFDFEHAIAEGNDPSAQSVATTDMQVNSKAIKVLIYNGQTVTPVTTNLQNAAIAENIPVIPVTETMPQGVTYQTWMMDEMNVLETALAQTTGH